MSTKSTNTKVTARMELETLRRNIVLLVLGDHDLEYTIVRNFLDRTGQALQAQEDEYKELNRKYGIKKNPKTIAWEAENKKAAEELFELAKKKAALTS